MKITVDKWFELSDLMLRITRDFNEEKSWNTSWSTSGWRMMSDDSLREILKAINVDVED